jgi:selenocysteine lyase/cysteine desulfurase
MIEQIDAGITILQIDYTPARQILAVSPLLTSRETPELGEIRIDTWEGNDYAMGISEWLGLEGRDGIACLSPVHYDTVEEIQRFGEVVGKITGDVD